jgi:hypothetical protein
MSKKSFCQRLLPWWLGNLVARWPGAIEIRGLGTGVRLGDVTTELHPVELGSIARWDMPTGIALAPDARSFVLGQRGPGGERIVRVALACGS